MWLYFSPICVHLENNKNMYTSVCTYKATTARSMSLAVVDPSAHATKIKNHKLKLENLQKIKLQPMM